MCKAHAPRSTSWGIGKALYRVAFFNVGLPLKLSKKTDIIIDNKGPTPLQGSIKLSKWLIGDVSASYLRVRKRHDAGGCSFWFDPGVCRLVSKDTLVV